MSTEQGGIHIGQVAGIYNQCFPGGQGIFLTVAVNFQKGHAAAGELLHDKALAAKEARAQLPLEEGGQLHALLRRQKGAFLGDNGPLGRDLHSADFAGEAGGKGHHTGAAPGGVEVLKMRSPEKIRPKAFPRLPPAEVCISMLGVIQTMDPLSVIMVSPDST